MRQTGQTALKRLAIDVGLVFQLVVVQLQIARTDLVAVQQIQQKD
jgi:hypothetical protein